MGPIVRLETSIRNYHYLLRNRPEERSSDLLRGGSLESCIVISAPQILMACECRRAIDVLFESVCVGSSIILRVVVYLAENGVTWLMEKRTACKELNSTHSHLAVARVEKSVCNL
jgi:hypothetical protein